jgi:cytochrome c-type biogenesis protein CcmH/NrfG
MRRLVLSVLGTRSHADHRADEALAYWKKALEIDPGDADTNNNVAYTLATDMNDPEKARSYAEKAAEKMPNNAAVLDTLGTVYMALKDMAKAENALMRAAAAAGDQERPAVLLHVGQLRLAQKNKSDAQKYVRLLEDMMSKDKRVRDEYTPQVAELKKKVEAM